MNMKNLEVTNVEHDVEHGFFWVELEGGKSVQCCLAEAPGEGFYDAINSNDTGANEGLCGDANEWAIDQYGADIVEEFLINQAKANHLNVI